MPSQFQAVVDVFNTKQIESPGARSPMANWQTARMGGIVARAGARTLDTASGIEGALGSVVGNAARATHCIEDAVSNVAESLLSAAMQAGSAIMDWGKAKLSAVKDKLSAWANAAKDKVLELRDAVMGQLGGLKGLKDWLLEKKREMSDAAIEAMEMLSAGYTAALHAIDALAYHAEEMAGVGRKVVCGMSAGVSQMAQSGLETLGYKHKDNAHVQIQNLFNDTRTLRASVTMNNLQAAVCSSHAPAPLPLDIPGAAAANRLMAPAQQEAIEAQAAANRFMSAHVAKLGAANQAQANVLVTAGVPAARDTNEGRPSAMPPVSPEKAQAMADATENMVGATIPGATVHDSQQSTFQRVALYVQNPDYVRETTLPPKLGQGGLDALVAKVPPGKIVW